MNSPMKDSFTELINNSPSQIEQAMESASHGLAKAEPVITALGSYLSCTTSQLPCIKDSEPMSTAEQPNSSFVHVELQVTTQANFTSCQTQVASMNSQFNNDHVYASSCEGSYTSDTPLQQVTSNLHQDLQQQHIQNPSNSCDKTTSLFQDQRLHTNSPSSFQAAQLTNTLAYESSANSSDQIVPNSISSESQLCQSVQADQFMADSVKGFQQVQFPSTGNSLEQLQHQSEAGTNSFPVSSVLTPSFSSSSTSETDYDRAQNVLGFEVIGVNQASVNNLEDVTHQFRTPEKMHIDEPDAVYQRADSSTDQFQIPTVPTKCSSDVCMQSFSSSDFHTQTALGISQASVVTGFQQSLSSSSSNFNNNFGASLTVSSNTTQSPAVCDISNDSYQSSSGQNSFVNKTFQQNPSVLQASTDLVFHEQSNLCQSKDVITNPPHHLPENSESLCSDAQHTYMPNQASIFQNNQNIDQPDQYSFHQSVLSTSTPTPVGFNQKHQLHPMDSAHYQQSLQTPQMDTFHQNPAHGLNYNTNAPLGIEVQSVDFQSNLEPSVSDSVLFHQSAIDIDQNQKKKFLTDSVHPSSSQLEDHSPFISYNSVKDPLLSEICASVNQPSVSQALGDFEMSTTSNQGHASSDPVKTSSDVAMSDFSSGSHLHPSSHSGFSVDSDPFSQLDLEAVVSRFQEEASASSNPQNDSAISTTQYQSQFSGFDYNKLNTTSASFPEIASTAADTNPNFTFNQPCQADQSLSSCPPQSTCASEVNDQSITGQFQHSSFNLASTPEVTSGSYHQPMQVQDSQPHTTYSFGNNNSSQSIVNSIETAMDISSNLSERTESSKISYEEIHMSIVEAGNALTKEMNGTELLDPLSTPVDSLGIFSTSSSDILTPDKSNSTTAAHDSFLTSSTNSETMQHQNTFSKDVAACSNSALTSNSMLNELVGSSIFSGILTDLQMSQELPNQEQMNQQAPVTIPNFLETPTVQGTHIHASNPGDGALATNITHDQPQASFVVTSLSSTNTGALGEGTSVNQSMVGDARRESFSTNQQLLSFPVSQATSMPPEPQVFGSQTSSSSSFFGLLAPDVIDLTGEAGGSQFSQAQGLSLNLESTSVDSVSSSSANPFLPVSTSLPGLVLQLPSQSSESKTSTLSSGLGSSVSLGTQQQMGQKPGTLSGLTLGVSPAGGGNQMSASSSSKQPHIVVSLDDLQRLLAQQNLSQPSPSIPQQQPYTTSSSSSSPQTLVLQKHASHSLKQSQPKFLIRGSTLTSLPRHQSQQIRDRLQLLSHQNLISENTVTVSSSQRNHETKTSFMSQETHQKHPNPFQFVSGSHKDQPVPHKLTFLHQATDQQPTVSLQVKQPQVLQQHQQSGNLFLQQAPKNSDHKLAPLQLVGSQQQHLVLGHHLAQNDQKLNLQAHSQQKSQGGLQKAQNAIQLAQMHQELLLLLKQQEFEEKHRRQLHFQHKHNSQASEKLEKPERPCSDSIRKDYKHLHSLLTLEATTGSGSNLASTQTKSLPTVLNVPKNLQGQSPLQLTSGGKSEPLPGTTSVQTLLSSTQASTAPFSFFPLNSSSSLNFQNIPSSQPNASLTKLAFVKTPSAPTFSKAPDTKDCKTEASSINSLTSYLHAKLSAAKLENGSLEKTGLDNLVDKSASLQGSTLIHTSAERKRSHTPLSIDLNSPANSSSGAASPILSPHVCEDGNTQLTLIERSADLQIKSDSMHGIDDAGDDNDNASFDVNAFHKRPSADEFHSSEGKTESVPMKVAKPSIDADAHSSLNPLTTSEPTFDFGSVVSSASNFSFVFGNKEENNSELFTFGLGNTATTPEILQLKDGPKNLRAPSTKPVAKAVGMRSSVPTQPVRPTSRKQQKEHSLKAYYPSKVGNMELKILQQPEPQHRARYQTEGSRGAIKDASQQGFPVIKLFGYSKPAKLQVFIGDECGRVKPHGFYQACRVFGKNSTACQELEIEDTTVIEVEMLPENDMIVRLDCVGILKLRNADVERRIGPKRAREKKKTNTRARLVMRCLVEKSDGSQQILQVVSSPILCTQPVGQPEISRMSLTDSSVQGGESLFIIGKNFKNKGTTIIFQQLDSNDEHVIWQTEAEIEQEYFQPTHLICKIPPYRDQMVELPQQAQIVVSCAGKRSDPHSFTYKPVPLFMKQEMKMDTDNSSSSISTLFVSPEAQHPSHMVQLTNSHTATTTTTTTFQLPQDTHQTTATEPPVTTLSSHFPQPASSLNLNTTQTPIPDMSSTTAATTPSSITFTPSASGEALASFLLEEKKNGLVPSSSRELFMTTVTPASVADIAGVNCIVHNNSDTNTASSLSYAISDISHQPPITSSVSDAPLDPQPSNVIGFHDVTSETQSIVNKSSQSSLPSKPFLLMVDPEALQSYSEGDKIQQLLQHILETHSKV